MIQVYSIVVDKTTHDTFKIFWMARRASSSPLESVDDYNFKILFSEDPVDGFVFAKDINGNEIIIDGAVGPLYAEPSLKDYNRNRERYFKVRAVKKTDATIFSDSKSCSNSDTYDGVIGTIQFAEQMLNNYFIGDSIYLMKRKVDGSRCPECWNQYTFRRTKTNCQTCHGTGFFDGFYRPIETQMSMDINPKVAEQSQMGEIQVTNIKGRMSHFPIVTPRDMVIMKSSNDRFTVVNVDYTKLPNLSLGRNSFSNDSYIISQIINMSQLNPSDPKFDVVVLGQDIRGGGSPSSQVAAITNASADSSHVGTGSILSQNVSSQNTGAINA